MNRISSLIAAAAADRERAVTELQVLGAPLADIRRYVRACDVFAQRITEPGHRVVIAALRVGRARLASGAPLIPTDARAWAIELVQEYTTIHPNDAIEAAILSASWLGQTWQALAVTVWSEEAE